MRGIIVMLVGLSVTACERQPQQSAQRPSPTNALATLPGHSEVKPAVLPVPKDKAQLERLILAGYMRHDDHLHPPGMNECPMNKGTDVVM